MYRYLHRYTVVILLRVRDFIIQTTFGRLLYFSYGTKYLEEGIKYEEGRVKKDNNKNKEINIKQTG